MSSLFDEWKCKRKNIPELQQKIRSEVCEVLSFVAAERRQFRARCFRALIHGYVISTTTAGKETKICALLNL